jgi:hypothetical protein
MFVAVATHESSLFYQDWNGLALEVQHPYNKVKKIKIVMDIGSRLNQR